MVVELVTGMIVLMRAVGHGKLCIIRKALCDLAPVQKAVVGGGVGNALLPGVHRAVPPAAGDQIQQHRMGLDIRAIHQPVIIGTVGQHIGQLLRHKYRGRLYRQAPAEPVHGGCCFPDGG